jgi:hypothetical protein
MPVANRDASELTRRRKAMSLNGWKSQIDVANIASNGSIVRREQPFFGTLDVVTQRNMGGCYCSQANSNNPYDFNGGGACGC